MDILESNSSSSSTEIETPATSTGDEPSPIELIAMPPNNFQPENAVDIEPTSSPVTSGPQRPINTIPSSTFWPQQTRRRRQAIRRWWARQIRRRSPAFPNTVIVAVAEAFARVQLGVTTPFTSGQAIPAPESIPEEAVPLQGGSLVPAVSQPASPEPAEAEAEVQYQSTSRFRECPCVLGLACCPVACGKPAGASAMDIYGLMLGV